MDELLTIFTPTYNRIESLKECYISLKNQTDNNFIWMIVDDGSTDNTREVVLSWIEENTVQIEYISKENGGKVSAINASLDQCKTTLWMCLDSDDILTNEAVRIFIEEYQKISTLEQICGLLALRTGKDGKVMNHKERIPQEVEFSTLSRIRYHYKIDTEYAIVYKTKIAKRFKYPLIPGEKFMPLSYVYDQIDSKYEYKIIHNDVMISEYMKDGITVNKKKLIMSYPKGYRLYHKQRIVLAQSYKLKVKSIILYNVASILDDETNFIKCVKESPVRFSTILFFFPSLIIKNVMFKQTQTPF